MAWTYGIKGIPWAWRPGRHMGVMRASKIQNLVGTLANVLLITSGSPIFERLQTIIASCSDSVVSLE